MKSEKRFREINEWIFVLRVFNEIRLKSMEISSISLSLFLSIHKIFWDTRGFLLSVSIIPFAVVVLAKIGQITRVKVHARKID